MNMDSQYDFAVIGGGLVGAACAYGLQRQGLKVLMLDEGDVARRASRGNFALVWVQSKGLGMPAYARWTRQSSDLYPGFAERVSEEGGFDIAYRRPGGYHLCLSQDELDRRAENIRRLHNQADAVPYRIDVLDGDEIRRRLPEVGPEVAGGTYCALDGDVNSLKLLRSLHSAFVRLGGTYKADSLVERIELNQTDPSSDLPADERSTVKHPHPFLSDPKVRKALSMALDRQALVDIGYGDAGRPSCDLVPAPEMYAAKNDSCFKQDIEGAKKLLDEAGWVPGADGIREKDGKKMKILFQTSVNPVRQEFQSIIKQWWSEIGIETELKQVDGSVFFGADAGSPDTLQKFYADVQMYANNFDGTDPQPYLAQWTCEKAPSPANQWQGENYNRYCDPAYDEKVKQMVVEIDPAKRAQLAKDLNNMITVESNVTLPLIDRGRFSAKSNTLGGTGCPSRTARAGRPCAMSRRPAGRR